MKPRNIDFYMKLAQLSSSFSYAERLKVGCVVAKEDMILSTGWNGTPSGMDNCCEIETTSGLVTKPEVLHAESNAILKCAREGRSTKDAWLFITHSPCIECAKLIIQSGISHVIFLQEYRNLDGVTLLNSMNVKCQSFSDFLKI